MPIRGDDPTPIDTIHKRAGKEPLKHLIDYAIVMSVCSEDPIDSADKPMLEEIGALGTDGANGAARGVRSIAETFPRQLRAPSRCETCLKDGSSGSCGCNGNTFHRNIRASICDSTFHMTAAVLSATGAPFVGRSTSTLHLCPCNSMCRSSVRARPIRRPPRYPRSRPTQRESMSQSAAADSICVNAFIRRCGASARSYTG
jgi:hypothetical protein